MPQLAARAGPAAPGAVDGHRLADLEATDPFTELVDPAGVLVTKRERRVPRDDAGLELVHQVQIRVARSCTADSNHHLPRPRMRVSDLDKLWFRFPRHQLQCPHDRLLSIPLLASARGAFRRAASP